MAVKIAMKTPPREPRRKLIEDHYRVDQEKNVILPGLLKHDDDAQRDIHDCFNLIVLAPITALNIMCWDWSMLHNDPLAVSDAWTGEWFRSFWLATLAYLVVDLLWVVFIPRCVKSPGTIVKHHVATIIYIFIPIVASRYEWCMGACMSVEINTWFLIARRMFNKKGYSTWTIDLPPLFSIRVKLISVFFYLTWIGIRCIFYPFLLLFFIREYFMVRQEGSPWNVMLCTVPIHSVFCVLNIRWSYDLLHSKLRYWKRVREGTAKAGEDVSKGL